MAKKKFDVSKVGTGSLAGLTKVEFNDLTKKESKKEKSALFDNEQSKGNMYPVQLPVEKLVPSKNNPYRVVTDNEDYFALRESISQIGIDEALKVRPIENDLFEILSGHRRFAVAKELGLTKVPAIIREGLTDAEATRIMVDDNLYRQDILISERAKAISMKYDAVKELIKDKLVGQRSKSSLIIAKEMGMGETTVKRFIRISLLPEFILDRVDNKKIPVKAGVMLSYIDEEILEKVIAIADDNKVKINESLAKKIREEVGSKSSLTEKQIKKILIPTAESKEPLISTAALKKEFFPKGTSNAEVNSTIKKLLSEWKKHNS